MTEARAPSAFAFEQGPKLAAMSDAEAEAEGQRAEAELKQFWGDQYDDNLDNVSRLIDEVGRKHPRVLDLLDRLNLLSSTPVAAYPVRIADRRYSR